MLDAFDSLPCVAFVPMSVESFGRHAKLDDEVSGQVLRLGLASFLAPEADQGGLIVAHDDPGIRAADERTALDKFAKLNLTASVSILRTPRFVETSAYVCFYIS